MGQGRGTRKADDPALRDEIERLRRQGQTLDRKALSQKFGVGVATIQLVRSEIDAMLQAERDAEEEIQGSLPPLDGGRTVQSFDGRRLFAIRRRKLMLQEELADLALISRGEIGHLERCHRKPTVRTLRKLASALEIHYTDLMTPEGADEFERPEKPEATNGALLTPGEEPDVSEAERYPEAAAG